MKSEVLRKALGIALYGLLERTNLYAIDLGQGAVKNDAAAALIRISPEIWAADTRGSRTALFTAPTVDPGLAKGTANNWSFPRETHARTVSEPVITDDQLTWAGRGDQPTRTPPPDRPDSGCALALSRGSLRMSFPTTDSAARSS